MAGLEDLISILKKEKEDPVRYSSPWKAVVMTLFILAFAFVYESYRIEDIFQESLAKLPVEKERSLMDQMKAYYFRNVIYLTIEVNQYKKEYGFEEYQLKEKEIIDRISKPIVILKNEENIEDSSEEIIDNSITKAMDEDINKKKNPVIQQQQLNIIKAVNKESDVNKTDIEIISSKELKQKQIKLSQAIKQENNIVKAIKKNANPKIASKNNKLNQSIEKLKPPYKVLMIGDSQMGGYIGIYIQKRFGKNKGKVLRKGIQSTGLAIPKYYNWPKKLEGFIRQFKPNILIVMVGTNDFHALYSIEKKRYYKFGTKEWISEYTKATQKIADMAKKNNILTFWLGLPLTEKKSLNDRIKQVNEIQIKALKNYKNVYYYSLWNLFDQDIKSVKKYITNKKGRKVRIRYKDGIHFAPTAAKYAVKEITEYMSRFLNLT